MKLCLSGEDLHVPPPCINRATSPSFGWRNGSLDGSTLSLETQMERDFMQLEGEVGHFAHEKKQPYLLALFTFVNGVEGDEATSPSFVAKNEAIEASSSSLEALIATRYMLCPRRMVRHAQDTRYRRQCIHPK